MPRAQRCVFPVPAEKKRHLDGALLRLPRLQPRLQECLTLHTCILPNHAIRAVLLSSRSLQAGLTFAWGAAPTAFLFPAAKKIFQHLPNFSQTTN